MTSVLSLIPDLPVLPGAACRGRDPQLWDDHVEGETHDEMLLRRAAGAEICARCPVAAECAQLRGERDTGIWAGRLWLTGRHGVATEAPLTQDRKFAQAAEDQRRRGLVLDAVEAGMSYRQIARTLGVHRRSVHRMVARERRVHAERATAAREAS